MTPPVTPPGARRDLWITLIGVGKLLKATTLLVVGVVALGIARPRGAAELHAWVFRSGLSPGNGLLHALLEKLAGLDPRSLREIGVGTFVYAALFSIEGLGLLFKKRWAEYFTIVITGSFVPIEVYETTHHVTAARVVATLLNVVGVAYLVWHLRHTRRGEAATS